MTLSLQFSYWFAREVELCCDVAMTFLFGFFFFSTSELSMLQSHRSTNTEAALGNAGQLYSRRQSLSRPRISCERENDTKNKKFPSACLHVRETCDDLY